MAFCNQCGKSLESGSIFCGACGARNESSPQSDIPKHLEVRNETVAPPSEQYTAPIVASTAPVYAEKPPKNSSGKGFFVGLSILLGLLVIGLGIFLFLQTQNLNGTRQDLDSLQQNFSELTVKANNLEIELAAEQANVNNLNTQLASEKATVASLQTELASTKGDLSTTQNALAAAEARIVVLEEEIGAAETRISTLENEIAKINTELAAALASNTKLTSDLNAIRSPRHFNSLQELTQWLAQDDTNTNPLYATMDSLDRAYVLQVKAMRDGYIMSLFAVPADYGIIYVNCAIAGGMFCLVDADDDSIISVFPVSAALRPLP